MMLQGPGTLVNNGTPQLYDEAGLPLYDCRGAGTPVNNGSLQCDHKLGLPLYDGPGAGYTCKK